jgi:hypothetical protein
MWVLSLWNLFVGRIQKCLENSEMFGEVGRKSLECYQWSFLGSAGGSLEDQNTNRKVES